MSLAPDWVKQLKPAEPHGTDLLTLERGRSSIQADKMALYLFGEEKLRRKNDVENILKNDPVFDKKKNYFDGRVDKFKTALARAKRMRQLAVKYNWDDMDMEIARKLISEPDPYGLHSSMFLTTLRDQTTEEQKRLFLDKAEAYIYIGAYAQTELGHGSNVRGLETQATWNSDRKTFTIHSPSLTASKWWIGSLGRTANHAVVMAQLYIDGKNYGPHAFMVQIRDLETHEPLEGRHVGDIGPKFGYNNMDNGFLLLNNVEIPHVNMLARFARVDKETNKYVKPPSSALTYGTMTWVRANIVLDAGSTLARGTTISLRYCAVRRQFQDKDAQPGADESPVLDYTMVQYRLFSCLASAFAMHFTGQAMMRLYAQKQEWVNNNSDIKGKPDVGKLSSTERGPAPEEVNAGADILADLHATSCGLKALASITAGEGLEVCRRACGGHGYSSFSGIGTYYADYLPTLTWEGDSYMITQQVARYLLKMVRQVVKGDKPNNEATEIIAEYLAKADLKTGKAPPAPDFDIVGNDADLVKAYGWRAAQMAVEAWRRRDVEHVAWNALLIDFWRLSTAFSQYLVVKNYYEALQSTAQDRTLDSTSIEVLRDLFRLYAFYNIENFGLEFLASSAASPKQVAYIRRKGVPEVMARIRPHAVKLADSWAFSDWQLDSSLGRADGNVYEDMFYRASTSGNNPLNYLTLDPRADSKVLVKVDRTPQRAQAKL